MDFDGLKSQLREFADARDWDRFHSPKNLAMAAAAESGELLEVFQWLSEEQSSALSDTQRDEARLEIADIIVYLVRLADKLDIDLDRAIADKIVLNSSRYPVDVSRGSTERFDRRGR